MTGSINFEQLLEAVKQLPDEKKAILQKEMNTTPRKKSKEEFLTFLLNGPTFSEEQITLINKAREQINKWRSK